METSHLRPVDSDTSPPPPGSDGKPRAQRRQRAEKSLPTDRMRVEVQQRILQTIGRLSGPSKRPVSIDGLSKIVTDVSKYTVGLSNNFFAEVGWLEKAGRGEYVATDALVDYTRRIGANPDAVDAALAPLTKAFADSWVWQTVAPQLVNGPASLAEIRLVLMQEAAAGQDHVSQLNNLIEWMKWARLIDVAGDRVTARASTETVVERPAAAEPAGDVKPSVLVQPKPPADAEGAKPTKSGVQSDVVVAFDLRFTLTAADIASLSPDQIVALFDGVGAIMAAKQALAD